MVTSVRRTERPRDIIFFNDIKARANVISRCQRWKRQVDRFHCWPDVSPESTLPFVKEQHCYCTLAKIWLFHIYSAWIPSECSDHFLILKEVDEGRREFERFGLASFNGHTIEERKEWFSNVWDKNARPNEYISIL